MGNEKIEKAAGIMVKVEIIKSYIRS